MMVFSCFVLLPLTAVLLCVACNERWREKALGFAPVAVLERASKGWRAYYWLLFALIMAAGIGVRCAYFDLLPQGMWQDSVMAGVEAFCLSSGGVDQYGISWPTYFTAWGHSQMSTLYSYLMIPFIRVMGLSRMTLRLPMLLISLLMLPIIWDFARRILDKDYALIVLLIAATNPWQIQQSRSPLESQLMPHVFLLAVYLLYLGMSRRWALYLSMVFFALTPYAYGLASFSAPAFLLPAAIYCLARRKVRPADMAVCVLIFLGLSGMYYYTMMINAFGWETATLGPITMPRFPDSTRANDLALTQENPYRAMIVNLCAFFEQLGQYMSRKENEQLNWAGTMYVFMVPAMLAGLYQLWTHRRAKAQRAEETPLRDGGMFVLLWVAAAAFNGMVIGGWQVHCNILYYPMMLVGAYAIYTAGKSLRLSAQGIAAIILVGFVGFGKVYFHDVARLQTEIGARDGYYEALVDTWDWDYDTYYVSTSSEVPKTAEANVMFAHQIDYSAKSEQTPLVGPDGRMTDWYYTERYIYEDFSEFEPDPMECVVYVINARDKRLFAPEDFILTQYGRYWAAYPRYWAE